MRKVLILYHNICFEESSCLNKRNSEMFRKKLLFLNYFVQKTNRRSWFRRVNTLKPRNTNLLRILRMNFLGLCKRGWERGKERKRERHDRTWTDRCYLSLARRANKASSARGFKEREGRGRGGRTGRTRRQKLSHATSSPRGTKSAYTREGGRGRWPTRFGTRDNGTRDECLPGNNSLRARRERFSPVAEK